VRDARVRRPPRLAPALAGVIVGLTITVFNAWVVAGDLELRANGSSVVVTVERCEQTGRSRTCEGSYLLAGQRYDNRLLLGADSARVGQSVPALVDRRHPGDASTTGLAPLVEALLLVLAGVVITVFSARRARPAIRSGPRQRQPRSRRPIASRARVWEGSRTEGGPVEADGGPLYRAHPGDPAAGRDGGDRPVVDVECGQRDDDVDGLAAPG
jgi:hypothetical protein